MLKIKKFSILFISIICILIGTSCDSDMPQTNCSLKFNINCQNLINRTRYVEPINDIDQIVKYKIKLNGPQDEKRVLELSKKSGCVKNLISGYWNIYIDGINKRGNILAEGSKIVYLNSNITVVDIILDKVIGNGSMKANLKWDKKRTQAENIKISVDLLDADKNSLKKELTLLPSPSNGECVIQADGLKSGTYILSARLISSGVCLAGLVEPVKIINGEESELNETFLIGDKSNGFDISIEKEVMLPIKGALQCDSEKIKAGSEFKLVFIPKELPTCIKESELSYNWYREGTKLEESSNTLTEIAMPGLHRYDLIITTEIEGSIGGFSSNVEGLS